MMAGRMTEQGGGKVRKISSRVKRETWMKKMIDIDKGIEYMRMKEEKFNRKRQGG